LRVRQTDQLAQNLAAEKHDAHDTDAFG